MFAYTGQCQCQNTSVTITLPETIENFSPRQCDCDFCMSRQISYLSHPDCSLHIESKLPLEKQQQGSNQADFITCSGCQTVIAVTYSSSKFTIGAVNATLLKDYTKMNQATAVSPKLLSNEKKANRWRDIWMSATICTP